MAVTTIETTTGGVTYGTGDYYNYILNDLFLPAIAEAVIYPNTFLKRLPRDKTRVQGKQVVFPIHTDDSNGVVALGPGGTLPEPDTERFAQYRFGVAHLYVRAKFDGITADASMTTIASWLQVVQEEMKAKTRILMRRRQQIYRNDGSGVLATVTVATDASAPTFTLTVGVNGTIESAATCSSVATRWLKVGMIVATVTPGSPGTITSIFTIATKTATVITAANGVGTPLVGDHIVTATAMGTALGDLTIARDVGYRIEPMGTQGILSDADPAHSPATGFQGIASSNAFNQAILKSNSGVARPNSLELMEEMWLAIVEESDTVPTVIYGDFTQVRKYGQLMVGSIRFNSTGGTLSLDGGTDDLHFNRCPLIADRDTYGNRLEFLDETDLRMYVLADPQWMDKDGSVYTRMADKDAYSATLYCRETMGCDWRRKHGQILDLES